MRQYQREGMRALVRPVNEINERQVGKEREIKARNGRRILDSLPYYCMYCIRTKDTKMMSTDLFGCHFVTDT